MRKLLFLTALVAMIPSMSYSKDIDVNDFLKAPPTSAFYYVTVVNNSGQTVATYANAEKGACIGLAKANLKHMISNAQQSHDESKRAYPVVFAQRYTDYDNVSVFCTDTSGDTVEFTGDSFVHD